MIIQTKNNNQYYFSSKKKEVLLTPSILSDIIANKGDKFHNLSYQ